MIRRALPLAALAGLLAVAGCQDATLPTGATSGANASGAFLKTTDPNAVDGEYVVVLDDATSATQVADIAAELGKKYNGTVTRLYKRALKGFSINVSDANAERIAGDSRVTRVESDVIVAVKPRQGNGNGRATGQDTSWGAVRVGGSHDGTGKRAWIIDSGIDLSNADLNVDTALSKNFVTKGNDKTPDDRNGHGTHVAGIIGAKNNTIGTIGIAPNASLVAVRVLDHKGNGQLSWVLAGIEYVTEAAESGDVANMSFTNGYSPTLDDAVRALADKGVKIAIAAGNDGANVALVSPARVDYPGVYTVSAIGTADSLASFSNYGWPVDYAAPGEDIISTKKGGGVVSMSGTSMATPHVAGLLLLGSIQANGIALGDVDGRPDPIAHY